MKELDQLLHDLRSPLARAKTLALLALDSDEKNQGETLELLLEALLEMEKRIAKLQS
jgi:hypothetical protein